MKGSNSIGILTGAGISQDSGLDTSRDEDDLWPQVRVEYVAAPEAYDRDTKSGVHYFNVGCQSMRSINIQTN